MLALVKSFLSVFLLEWKFRKIQPLKLILGISLDSLNGLNSKDF